MGLISDRWLCLPATAATTGPCEDADRHIIVGYQRDMGDANAYPTATDENVAIVEVQI